MEKQEEPYERDRPCRKHHRSGDAEYEHRQDTHQYQWEPHPIRGSSCPRRTPFRKEVAALPAPSRAFAHAFLAAGAGLPLHGTPGVRTKADCSTAGLAAGHTPVPESLTQHSLRHTYISAFDGTRPRPGAGLRGRGAFRYGRDIPHVHPRHATRGRGGREQLRGDARSRIRTCDLWLRRPALYPLSYARSSLSLEPNGSGTTACVERRSDWRVDPRRSA
jgi:hypothetical protein